MPIMLMIEHDSGNGAERHYSVKDACKLAGISREWFYILFRRGDVQADYFEGGRRWVAESEINRLRRCRQHPTKRGTS